MPQETTNRIVEVIRAVPRGRVASYGEVAAQAGYPGGAAGARQVVRILNTMSKSRGLPWWRIIRKDGTVALPPGEGRELQIGLLESEGVTFVAPGRVDMGEFGAFRREGA